MKLNELSDNPSARKARKTGGRGVKGQKSRAGVRVKGFEGGQMPLHRRLPKRGFVKPFRLEYAEVNVGALQKAVDAGRLDPAKPVDAAALQAAGLVTKLRDGVRLLGKGELTASLTLSVTGASRRWRSFCTITRSRT